MVALAHARVTSEQETSTLRVQHVVEGHCPWSRGERCHGAHLADKGTEAPRLEAPGCLWRGPAHRAIPLLRSIVGVYVLALECASGQTRWHTPVIQHSGLRQVDHELEASLGCIVRPCLKKQGLGYSSVVDGSPSLFRVRSSILRNGKKDKK
jgi:hypothetical protein